jgi:hypothetical protein
LILGENCTAGDIDRAVIGLLYQALSSDDLFVQDNGRRMVERLIVEGKFTGREEFDLEIFKGKSGNTGPNIKWAEGDKPVYRLSDGLVQCLSKAITSTRDPGFKAKLPQLITMFIGNNRIHFHNESVLALFNLAFQSALRNNINTGGDFGLVDNYFLVLLSRADTLSSDPANPITRRRLSSFEGDNKLTKSITMNSELGTSIGMASPVLSSSTHQGQITFASPGNRVHARKLTGGLYAITSPEHSRKPSYRPLQQYQGPFSASKVDEEFRSSFAVLPTPLTPQLISHEVIESTGVHRQPEFSKEACDKVCEDYLEKQMTFLVDQAEIYWKRVETLEAGRNLRKSVSAENEPRNQLPYSVIPPTTENRLELYSKVVKLDLTGERGQAAGTFGWCFLCRKPADFYCKDSRLPLCGHDCKLPLAQYIQRVDNCFLITENGHQHVMNYRLDLLILLDYIMDMIKKECADFQRRGTDSVLNGMLDNVISLLEAAGSPLTELPHYIQILKERVIFICGQTLLRFGSRTMRKTCELIGVLWRRYRRAVKKEIYSLMEGVILGTIESPWTTFSQRVSLLQLMASLLGDKDMILEIFLNYDACPKYDRLLKRILKNLCKKLITQSKPLDPTTSQTTTL